MGYAMFDSGSMKIAMGPGATINSMGLTWTALKSGVVLTTMQIQDLKGQADDMVRQRKTLVLHLGDDIARGSIGLFICMWTWVAALFWSFSSYRLIPAGSLAGLLAWRVIMRRTTAEDRISWYLRCVWLVLLYSFPILAEG
jgi:hypothetical protein